MHRLLLKINLYFYALLIFAGCSSTAGFAEIDLNHLSVEVNHVDDSDDQPYYLLTISGFSDSENRNYKATLSRLNNYPDDLLEVSESKSGEDPMISARIKDHPLSLNRVLWQLGREHLREHEAAYTPEIYEGGFTIISSMPEMLVSKKDFQKNVQYPAALRGTGIEGEVQVRFIVNQFGEVENPEIIQGLHELADKEALLAINEIKFKPGMIDGVPIRVRQELPVLFQDN